MSGDEPSAAPSMATEPPSMTPVEQASPKPTAQSESGRIRRVVLKHARDAFADEERIRAEWRALNYHAPPDLGRAIHEYDRFVELIADHGVSLDFLPPGEGVGMDSIYVRDASVVSDRGVILCRMGKAARRGEPEAQGLAFQALGLPVLGRITGDGCLEGGDVVWLDRSTVAVGRGYRTNAEGIRQLRALLGDEVEVIEVPLPHYKGPDDVFHLMSILSPLDSDLALVHSPLMPVPFRERLLARGMEFVEAPAEELDAKGCNVLALGPRRCLAAEGSPITRSRLEAAGVEVRVYEGEEITQKGSGGPTCLTRPLLRDPD
jgi:N-dimethylarginine dimethylaminohydrolase